MTLTYIVLGMNIMTMLVTLVIGEWVAASLALLAAIIILLYLWVEKKERIRQNDEDLYG